MTTTTTTDRIEKQITLRATPARVWRAISTPKEFATWFGLTPLRDDFAPGKTVHASVTYQGKEMAFTFEIDRMEPEQLMAFRWHPFAIDPAVDYSKEPMTLVELRLAPAGTGTLLTVTESGFDRIPVERRARAFEMDSSGWAQQLDNIKRHVDA
jgi:uncharacterized protein YndB with AHSA1/START domain